ncbi:MULTISPECIES: phytanoyl-CoA dioxygenase family protein [unclassified Bradyrhizobium]|uniref:phytanoyl-CoA dioxygenase family protein n=1 Tax=unclassified Bradyrhizobium TaxID=2631580 RepID=UPI0028E26E86|nr:MULTISPECIES: phytanoyl-CoA dioxygenase family protein [unclassified Bradyrhizobium]
MSKELDAFNADGFFVARELLDKEAIAQFLHSMKKTIEDQLRGVSAPGEHNDVFSALKALHGADIDRYKRVLGALWRKEETHRLAHHHNIVNFLKGKFGWTDIFLPGGHVVHIMAHELRIPNGYFGFVTHQDFPSVQGSLDGVVVWFPLVDVNKDNFPLEVIPRTHKLGVLPTIKHGTSTSEVEPEFYNQSDFVPVEVNVGDVIFMSVFTVHRSSLEGKLGNCRIAISTRFDNGDEPTFVDRAYPTAYIRSVAREQYYDNFPTQEQIEATFRRTWSNN